MVYATEDDRKFEKIRVTSRLAPASLGIRRWIILRLYEANRYKFLQNEDLRITLCATRGYLVYASRGDNPWA